MTNSSRAEILSNELLRCASVRIDKWIVDCVGFTLLCSMEMKNCNLRIRTTSYIISEMPEVTEKHR